MDPSQEGRGAVDGTERAPPEEAALVVLALLMKAAAYQTDDPAALLKGASAAAARAFLAGSSNHCNQQVLGSNPIVDIETHVGHNVWQAITN